MIHDETTTKLELPTKSSNVVRVQFGSTEAKPQAAEPFVPRKRSNLIPSWDELNLSSPWVLRLLAVLAVLGLSLLML